MVSHLHEHKNPAARERARDVLSTWETFEKTRVILHQYQKRHLLNRGKISKKCEYAEGATSGM